MFCRQQNLGARRPLLFFKGWREREPDLGPMCNTREFLRFTLPVLVEPPTFSLTNLIRIKELAHFVGM